MKTVVYGLGKSSISVLKHLSSVDAKNVCVVNKGDKRIWKEKVKSINKNFECIEEIESKKTFDAADRVILSPGIPRAISYLKDVQPSKIIGEIEYAFSYSSVPVIAVTGSNGKTTTATMIQESLESFGKKVFLGGNIGIPYADIINKDYDFAVIEVSSFQLESIISFKPLISVITNITPNHMERYSSFDDYKAAKLNIFKNQTRGSVFTSDQSFVPDYLNSKKIKRLKDFSLEKSKIVGDHNLLNLFCANEICKELLLNYSKDIFQKFINSFKAPAFRLEFICEKNQKRFYNDSKSTNLESTLKAIKSFDSDLCLVIGGKLRSNDISEFIALRDQKITKLIAYGESASKLGELLNCTVCKNLEDAFIEIQNIKKGTVLFSPGFPSFDQYKNFEDRGLHYNSLIESLID